MVGLENNQFGIIGPSISVKGVMGDVAGKWAELGEERIKWKDIGTLPGT